MTVLPPIRSWLRGIRCRRSSSVFRRYGKVYGDERPATRDSIRNIYSCWQKSMLRNAPDDVSVFQVRDVGSLLLGPPYFIFFNQHHQSPLWLPHAATASL